VSDEAGGDYCMEKAYYLDLKTLLEYLQGQQALLSTEVSVPGIRARCTGYIFFRETTIIGCLIQLLDGSVWREGEEAYRFLTENREWYVRIDLNIEQTFRAMRQRYEPLAQSYVPPPPPRPRAPRAVKPLDAGALVQFSTKQRLLLRMVYTLVNGQRTVDQIKAQVHVPAEVVDDVLATLHNLGAIE
jgi:hypothetical protein